MKLLKYYSPDDLDISELTARFLGFDLEEAEVEEDAPERWQAGDLSDFFNESYHDCFPGALAEEVHNFVRLVAHPYRRCFDRPAKSPKNAEIESAIKNKGTAGCCTFMREDEKFVVQPLAEWMFFGDHLRRKHYYTSDNRITLLYHDIDCHLEYQTQADAEAARSLIERETAAFLGVSPLFLGSDRGENGYGKVDTAGVDPKTANEVYDEYQEAIQLLFAKHGIMADFEIKGTVTWIDGEGKLHAGRYGKLPMCASRWDHRWHRSLVTARKVTIPQIEAFIKKVKAEVSDEDIARHEEAKHRAFVTHYLPVGKEQEWRLIASMSLGIYEDSLVSYKRQPWIARSLFDDATIKKLWPDYEPDLSCESSGGDQPVEVQVEETVQAPTPAKKLTKAASDALADLGNDPDSFVRQRKALLKLAQLLKRVPSVDEALKFIQDNGLYTGDWGNSARRGRVRGILKFITKTFNPTKCTKANRTQATVNIGKYDAWAKTKFPNGLGGGKRRIVTDELEIREINRCGRIEWESLKTVADLNALLLQATNRAVVLVDEAQELDRRNIQTALYLALDQRRILLQGSRKGSTPVAIPIQDFTLLLASTDEYQLLQPLRDRMRLTLRFQFYQPDDLEKIARMRAASLGWEVEPEVFQRAAERSRGTPRLVLRLLQAARRCSRADAGEVVTVANLERACTLEGIDHLGLGPTEQQYLGILLEGPTRLNMLASRLGLPSRTVAEVTEQFLIRAGLVVKDDQGRRQLSAEGREHAAK